MHLDKLIGTDTTSGIFRSYVDEPYLEASDWTDKEALDYINMEQRHLFSIIRDLDNDWFGRTYIFPVVNGTYEYYLPMNCVAVRRVEVVDSNAVSGSSPNYVIDETRANPVEVMPILLSEKNSLIEHNGRGMIFTSGYHLYDEKIVFEPVGDFNSRYYVRIYYQPQAPDLHRGYPTAAAASTITLATSTATTTLGKVSPTDNYYQGMRIEIIEGTGAGQIRRITKYAGSTRIATIETPWGTTPNTTSKYSIVSPVQEDYHELLALGAVIRAKGIKTEDDASAAGAVYEALRADLVNALQQRNKQTVRRVVSKRGRDLWF